jgi:hypothetical protein
MADKNKRTPLVGKGDKTPGRKVGAEGTPQNPKIKRNEKGEKVAEIIDPKFKPRDTDR